MYSLLNHRPRDWFGQDSVLGEGRSSEMKIKDAVKLSPKDFQVTLKTGNQKIILTVLKEYASAKKKSPIHLKLKEKFNIIELGVVLNKLGLVFGIEPNEIKKSENRRF
jgi:hypothetical protein